MKADCERREEHLQAKTEMEVQSNQHSIAILLQNAEIAEQKSIVAENSDKQRKT